MSSARVVLRLSDVVKTYPGVVALKGVSFEVTEGEVHALVGENGAGKSTLMAVAAGSTLPDSGQRRDRRPPLDPPTPAAAQALGLAVVYQHLSILEDLTVAENMVFAMPRHLRPPVARVAAWTQEKLAAIGARIDPAGACHRAQHRRPAAARDREGARARVERARPRRADRSRSRRPRPSGCSSRSVRSPTTAPPSSTSRTVCPEVRRIADRITVLRDGETRGTRPCERGLRVRCAPPRDRPLRRPGVSREGGGA